LSPTARAEELDADAMLALSETVRRRLTVAGGAAPE
jgi:hypothetical protein